MNIRPGHRRRSRKLDQLRRERIDNVRLLVFDDTPINKPHGLNIGTIITTM